MNMFKRCIEHGINCPRFGCDWICKHMFQLALAHRQPYFIALSIEIEHAFLLGERLEEATCENDKIALACI